MEILIDHRQCASPHCRQRSDGHILPQSTRSHRPRRRARALPLPLPPAPRRPRRHRRRRRQAPVPPGRSGGDHLHGHVSALLPPLCSGHAVVGGARRLGDHRHPADRRGRLRLLLLPLQLLQRSA